MSVNYFPFNLSNLELIQNELYAKHGHLATGDKLQTLKVDWTPENFLSLYTPIQDLVIKHGTVVRTARFFYTPPGVELEPHVDGKEITEKYWALNIPINVPSDNHYQEWFDYTGEMRFDSNQIYTDSIKPKEPEKLVLVDRLVLLSSHFVKVGTFHKVANNSSKGRFILSIRFTNPSFIANLK
jgi:hypothetical protein